MTNEATNEMDTETLLIRQIEQAAKEADALRQQGQACNWADSELASRYARADGRRKVLQEQLASLRESRRHEQEERRKQEALAAMRITAAAVNSLLEQARQMLDQLRREGGNVIAVKATDERVWQFPKVVERDGEFWIVR